MLLKKAQEKRAHDLEMQVNLKAQRAAFEDAAQQQEVLLPNMPCLASVLSPALCTLHYIADPSCNLLNAVLVLRLQP